MSDNCNLHLISFNVPYPPNYGGVIDVFYKVKALSEAGVNIHLHCFQYGRDQAKQLHKYCKTVSYYPRKRGINKLVGAVPFIVASRSSVALLQRLKENKFPIFFEGLHATYLLDHPDLKGRQKYVRIHNIEWQYYKHLASLEKNVAKKIYFETESRKLKKYEKILSKATGLFTISNSDQAYYANKYSNVNLVYAFHENNKPECKKGLGKYLLYHGDLSVKDNQEAAIFLLKEVFSKIDFPIKIAGLNPGKALIWEVSQMHQVEVLANPSYKKMQELISNAQINVLISFQSAGMKLKVLNALYLGRHCIVNENMVDKNEMADLCLVKKSAKEFVQSILENFEVELSENDINKRYKVLNEVFSNSGNAKKIINRIFQHK